MKPAAFLRPEEAFHIDPGINSADILRGCAGAVLYDRLGWGPADADPVRHGEDRRAFWRDEILAEPGIPAAVRRGQLADLGGDILSAGYLEAAVTGQPESHPLLIWTSAFWREQLSLWWTLDALARSGVCPARVWLAQAPVALGCASHAQLEEAFALRTPVGRRRMRSGASLWRKYAAASPRAFDAARLRGVKDFPHLASVGEVHGWMFPRVVAPSPRVRLSLLDQGIFDRLTGGGWTRPIDLIRDRAFWEWIVVQVGDHNFASRLRAWAAHCSAEPALLSRREPGENGFTNVSYWLTPLGERIRERWLDRIEEAPPMWAGGCRVYEGRRPLVQEWSGDGWRLARYA
ncbi:MAG: hypothetical protein ACRC33_10870 [Gemmataceae bacterium]